MWSSARRCRIPVFAGVSAALPRRPACAAYPRRRAGRAASSAALRRERRTVPHCEPSGVLTCRKCRSQTGLTVGTVMKRSRTPLSVWFWAAYLVDSQTPGISAVQLQRQLGLSRYETAFQLLHKLRAGMVRPDRDRIGGRANEHVEVDETWVGGRARGEGRGVITKLSSPAPSRCAAARPEPRRRAQGRALRRARSARRRRRPKRKVALRLRRGRRGEGDVDRHGRLERLRRPAQARRDHRAIAECGDPEISEEFLPISHLVFANLKTWLAGTHHGVSARHLQAYLNEFTFQFNVALPVQRLPLAARHCKQCEGADLRRTLLSGLGALYM